MNEVAIIMTVAEWKGTIDTATDLTEKVKTLISQNCCPLDEGDRYFRMCSEPLSKLVHIVDTLKARMGTPELLIPKAEELVAEINSVIPTLQDYISQYVVDKNANR
ncbi:MAG: hypothetical protein FWG51_05970 [Firmicutes bacterium]|nr:hypothetical protein [Bacillota bacterium]